MKIHFDGVNFASTSGPNTFANRLARALFEAGHEVQENAERADVSLVFIERSGAQVAPRVVQRLDGLWMSPDEFVLRNTRIKDLYVTSDAIVFQSEFDKAFITKRWGETNHHAVIRNGIELKPVKQLTIAPLIEMRQRYDTMFCCSSNWHGQKRLRTNVELFIHLRRMCCPNSCLIVLGNHPDYNTANPHVFYAGSETHDVCAEIYSACNWMLHTAWLDHSPNCVVEALAQGTPVICTEDGGTKELVRDFGVTLDETRPYDFGLTEYDNPPTLDVTQVKELPPKSALGNHADIDIKHVAERYIKLFQEIQ